MRRVFWSYDETRTICNIVWGESLGGGPEIRGFRDVVGSLVTMYWQVSQL